MRAREVNQRIRRLGGVQVRQTGSHRQFAVTYTDADGNIRTARTTVAQHPGDIAPGAQRMIEKNLEPALGKGWLR